jgi:small subunit ribosomal protein S7
MTAFLATRGMATQLKLFDPADAPDWDPEVAGKFIRCLTGQGRLATAQRVFDEALEWISKHMPGTDPMEVFTQAVERVKPSVEVRSKRVGGATYQVPMRVNKTSQQRLAIRRLIRAARSKAGRPMSLRLAEAILAAYRPGPPTGPPGTCPTAAAQRRARHALPG